ncbi:PREDICTED: uncharacterized protein LOC109581054 isoform X2 [Amphimedon queenslandica]|uniref:Death domain-containing protein n=1 Tax=Amphimedon queenslandica TaxID=400682 RepID=A0A1X7VVZ6_AMPQE|nr:PREDICTED: uncharacterized protein LOC109581054 isoform X2 [Amphimedon queenslandica]|eukprot:XP_019850372.1 PREDICTED: uncharacterized protein LOC109581054 isoform X2 [Amphimedon queenslandica]
MASNELGNEAKEILRDHYGDLAKNIQNPVQLAEELYQYRIISEAALGEIKTEGWTTPNRNTALLRNVRLAIGQDHTRLRVVARALAKDIGVSSIGDEILQSCKMKFGQEEENNVEEPVPVRSIDRHTILRSDDLATLERLLKDVNDWEGLGLFLGIKKTSINRIGRDKKGVRDCRREMLFCWLSGSRDDMSSNVERTFNALIKALKDIENQEAIDGIESFLSK